VGSNLGLSDASESSNRTTKSYFHLQPAIHCNISNAGNVKHRHKVKRQHQHLRAVHNLADILGLNPVLAAAAAAMGLPNRTKVTFIKKTESLRI
jgi:hypothetical protein